MGNSGFRQTNKQTNRRKTSADVELRFAAKNLKESSDSMFSCINSDSGELEVVCLKSMQFSLVILILAPLKAMKSTEKRPNHTD